MDRILGGSGMFCRNLQRCTEKRKNGGSIRWSASWRDYDNDDTLCATGKNGISRGRNPVGGAYSEKCPSVFLWNSVCLFAGGIAAISVGKCGEIRKCRKDGGRRILTLGGILIGMELLLPAVLGYDRVAAESYPVLPLLAGADLPGNVLARFDILWMGFLLYSLLLQ